MYLQNDCMHIFYQYLSASFFFCYDFVASQGAIHSTHDDHDVRVVSSNPGLVMQSADVEVFARIRQASIMFLKNLVKAGEIQVDILFYSIVIIAYLWIIAEIVDVLLCLYLRKSSPAFSILTRIASDTAAETDDAESPRPNIWSCVWTSDSTLRISNTYKGKQQNCVNTQSIYV